MSIRRLTADDAGELAALLRANRSYLQPWDPIRDPSFYTEQGQRQIINEHLSAGNTLPHAIVEGGRIVGRISLNNIVRGPFLSASLGYLVAQDTAGRGVATTAVAQILEVAFTDQGLHRVEAGTLLHNVRSQRVLARNGFERFGMAPRYLKIAGEWQDHYLFQLLAENWLAARESGA
ncbi:GNAT family protein [Actinoplanes sp. NPDC051861]|uniref:GNAT family N-acetyltransferase n=1 Tax=Actinoplanes sp. NPDC051861 TaxID=3155170 RepID=UPI003432B720